MTTLTAQDLDIVQSVLLGPRVPIWNHIPGIPKRFVASDDGIIKTLEYETTGMRNGESYVRHMPERILKQRVSKGKPSYGKHPIVTIYAGTSRAQMSASEKRVSRLVLSAFQGLPYDPTDQRQVQRWRIRHLDGDYMNCSAANLEWVYSAGSESNDSGVKDQTVYERNLDGYKAARQMESASEFMARLYGEDVA